MSAVCHIVCAGPCRKLAIDRHAGDFVIAADGGYARCASAGIEPDLFVGDLDSLGGEAPPPSACPSTVLPVDKDDTDTLFACKEGLQRGYVEFALHCALGGDLGHELANLQTLAFLDEHGAHGVLYGDHQQVHLVTPRTSPLAVASPVGTRVSVFAFGGPATGVFEHGLRWELDDARLDVTLPVGVSNRSEAERFEIGVGKGALLVVIGAEG